MSLNELLASAKLKRHKATAQEIHKLFEVVERDLADARVAGISDDRRFTKEHHHVLDYLDDCRSKRNTADYMGTHVTSEQEVAELVREARSFSRLLHDLIGQRHPTLQK